MAVVVSISKKQQTNADRFGNTNFKRVGPNTAKNRQKDKKKSNTPYQGHGGHHVDLEQVRKMNTGNNCTIGYAVGREAYQRVKADTRQHSSNVAKTGLNYKLTAMGIQKTREFKERWSTDDDLKVID